VRDHTLAARVSAPTGREDLPMLSLQLTPNQKSCGAWYAVSSKRPALLA
jgi:hypothetical protein